MNDKDLKRRLEDELESIAPKMSQRVANAPIGTSSEGGAKRARAPRRKVRFTVAVSAIAAVLVIAIVLAVVVPPLFKTVPEQGEGGYLLMNINPDVEILFDEDGKVTSVKSGNADADVLLADESFRSSLVGESVESSRATPTPTCCLRTRVFARRLSARVWTRQRLRSPRGRLRWAISTATQRHRTRSA